MKLQISEIHTRIYHIKAYWETHQNKKKCRDKLVRQWRAPHHKVLTASIVTGGLQRLASTQILSFGVSSQSFDVDLTTGESHYAGLTGFFFTLFPVTKPSIHIIYEKRKRDIA